MERDRIIYEKVIELLKNGDYVDFNIITETIEEDLRKNYPKYGKIRVANYIENLENNYFIGYFDNEERFARQIYIRRDFNYEQFIKKDEIIDYDFSIDNFDEVIEKKK
ncbi:hypothetical protein [Aquiflexum balticum]|nr:hypothetical protein [Aquiflexum balticum]